MPHGTCLSLTSLVLTVASRPNPPAAPPTPLISLISSHLIPSNRHSLVSCLIHLVHSSHRCDVIILSSSSRLLAPQLPFLHKCVLHSLASPRRSILGLYGSMFGGARQACSTCRESLWPLLGLSNGCAAQHLAHALSVGHKKSVQLELSSRSTYSAVTQSISLVCCLQTEQLRTTVERGVIYPFL